MGDSIPVASVVARDIVPSSDRVVASVLWQRGRDLVMEGGLKVRLHDACDVLV